MARRTNAQLIKDNTDEAYMWIMNDERLYLISRKQSDFMALRRIFIAWRPAEAKIVKTRWVNWKELYEEIQEKKQIRVGEYKNEFKETDNGQERPPCQSSGIFA